MGGTLFNPAGRTRGKTPCSMRTAEQQDSGARTTSLDATPTGRATGLLLQTSQGKCIVSHTQTVLQPSTQVSISHQTTIITAMVITTPCAGHCSRLAKPLMLVLLTPYFLAHHIMSLRALMTLHLSLHLQKPLSSVIIPTTFNSHQPSTKELMAKKKQSQNPFPSPYSNLM